MPEIYDTDYPRIKISSWDDTQISHLMFFPNMQAKPQFVDVGVASLKVWYNVLSWVVESGSVHQEKK